MFIKLIHFILFILLTYLILFIYFILFIISLNFYYSFKLLFLNIKQAQKKIINWPLYNNWNADIADGDITESLAHVDAYYNALEAGTARAKVVPPPHSTPPHPTRDTLWPESELLAEIPARRLVLKLPNDLFT